MFLILASTRLVSGDGDLFELRVQLYLHVRVRRFHYLARQTLPLPLDHLQVSWRFRSLA